MLGFTHPNVIRPARNPVVVRPYYAFSRWCFSTNVHSCNICLRGPMASRFSIQCESGQILMPRTRKLQIVIVRNPCCQSNAFCVPHVPTTTVSNNKSVQCRSNKTHGMCRSQFHQSGVLVLSWISGLLPETTMNQRFPRSTTLLGFLDRWTVAGIS
jgi:hypothetical protein